MRKLSLIFGLSLVALTAVWTPESFAGKKDKTTSSSSSSSTTYATIEMTGISAFDPTFTDAKSIHDTLATQEGNINTARSNLLTALGAATDAPLATALSDLKSQAEGKIKLGMSGTTPKLSVDDAVPANVKTGIDAANGLVDASVAAVASAQALVSQAQALVSTAAGFPAQIPSLVTDPMAAIKATKTVASNVKAVGQTPSRIDAVIKAAEGVITDVKSAFSS